MDDQQPHHGLEAMTPGVLCRAVLLCGTGLLLSPDGRVMLLEEGSCLGVIAGVRAMWRHHLVKGGSGIVPLSARSEALPRSGAPFSLRSCTAPTLPACSAC